MTEKLETLVAEELAIPVDERVVALAAAIAKAHGRASRAVLFYGSCLREKQYDGLMLDFYLIVSEYAAAYDRRWLAVANRLIPPNVFVFEADGMLAKYAVLSQADFHRLNGPETRNVSVWARFAQPSRLVWAANDAARKKAIAAVARAAPTLLASAILTVPDSDDPLDLWRGAFRLTFSAELRAERRGRSGAFVDFDPERYRRFTEPAIRAIAAGNTRRAGGGWARRRIEGKLLTVLRLAKASATFAGGVDYIAWKINRHAGTAIEIKPWQRRWPLLAAISLVPKLLRSGAVR
jgi:hypothetical protein